MDSTWREVLAALALASALAAAGCGGAGGDAGGGAVPAVADTAAASDTGGAAGPQAPTALVKLLPTQDSHVRGTLTLVAEEGGLRVTGRITGLTPGLHGIHVHEFGDCAAPDASSAGGHFAPGGTPHGAPTDPAGQRHAGDWGNIRADSTGTAQVDILDPVAALIGPSAIVGKAVIVHAGQDDLETQPSGNAGARAACGVVERR
ncbi:MAG: superoxide dismutase family protein [Candidatus Latescibacterota bacterium]